MASKLSSPAAPPVPRTSPAVLSVAACLASAAAFYFGTGLHPLWPLTWIAPLPVLLVATRLSGRTASLVAFLAFVIGALNMLHYFRILHLPVPAQILACAGPSLVFATAVGVFRRALRRGQTITAAFALPSIWVGYEYLLSVVSVHSTFDNLGYTQLDCLPLIQFASLTGIWSLSFCLFFFAATVAVLAQSAVPARPRRTLALAAAVFYVIVFGYGTLRLLRVPDAPTATIGLAASDTRDNLIATTPQTSIALLQRYAGQATALAARGAQIVVLPEHLAIVTDDNTVNSARNVDAVFNTAAAVGQSLILIGVDRATGGIHYNEARLYSPTESLAATYHKQHLLPPVEDVFTPGTTRTVFTQLSGLWGVAICKDMDFPLLSRQYGRDGVGLLLVPAWDFSIDGWLHGRMAILRGVESGFSIARAAKQGILTVSDDRGRVLAQRPTTKDADFVTLLAEVPVRHTATVYARFGDWFAILNLCLLAAVIAAQIRAPTPRIPLH